MEIKQSAGTRFGAALGRGAFGMVCVVAAVLGAFVCAWLVWSVGFMVWLLVGGR
jgi:hypothetical protein